MGEGSISTIAATVPLDEELREEREESGVWHRWLKECNHQSLGSGQLALIPFQANPRETNEMCPHYKRSSSLPQTPQHPGSSRASHPVACTRPLSALTPFRLDLLSPTGGHASLYGIVTDLISLSVDYLPLTTAQYHQFLATPSVCTATPSTRPPTRVTSQMRLSPAPKVLDPGRLTPGILADKSEHHRNRRRTRDWRKHSKTPGAICAVGFVRQVYNARLW